MRRGISPKASNTDSHHAILASPIQAKPIKSSTSDSAFRFVASERRLSSISFRIMDSSRTLSQGIRWEMYFEAMFVRRFSIRRPVYRSHSTRRNLASCSSGRWKIFSVAVANSKGHWSGGRGELRVLYRFKGRLRASDSRAPHASRAGARLRRSGRFTGRVTTL